MQREYLTENSHVFEEIIEFGLGKFGVDSIQSKYAVDLIRTNKLFYLTNRAALKDLLESMIKHQPTVNAFLDWLDAICTVYLVDSEIKLLKKEKKFGLIAPDFGPRDFVVANHEDVLQLKDRVDNLEKRIEVLLDLIEELAKKI
jgi:hypothetical protein